LQELKKFLHQFVDLYCITDALLQNINSDYMPNWA